MQVQQVWINENMEIIEKQKPKPKNDKCIIAKDVQTCYEILIY